MTVELLPPGSFAEPPASRPHRTPMKFRFRLDLYRTADNALMATSLVRKALNVPGQTDPIRTVRSAGYALDESFKN